MSNSDSSMTRPFVSYHHHRHRPSPQRGWGLGKGGCIFRFWPMTGPRSYQRELVGYITIFLNHNFIFFWRFLTGPSNRSPMYFLRISNYLLNLPGSFARDLQFHVYYFRLHFDADFEPLHRLPRKQYKSQPILEALPMIYS